MAYRPDDFRRGESRAPTSDWRYDNRPQNRREPYHGEYDRGPPPWSNSPGGRNGPPGQYPRHGGNGGPPYMDRQSTPPRFHGGPGGGLGRGPFPPPNMRNNPNSPQQNPDAGIRPPFWMNQSPNGGRRQPRDFPQQSHRQQQQHQRARQCLPFGDRHNGNQARQNAEEAKMMSTLGEHKINTTGLDPKRFPDAKVYCHLCYKHLNRGTDIKRHLVMFTHVNAKQALDLGRYLRHLPARVGEEHAVALTQLVERESKRVGVSPQEHARCLAVVDRIRSFFERSLSEQCPEPEFSLHGSLIYGFGLADKSDINIGVGMTKTDDIAHVMEEIVRVLKEDTSGAFKDVQDVFTSKVPRIRFLDSETKRRVELCLSVVTDTSAARTARLLADYAQLDPRVEPLCIAFRYWANLCSLDQQERGTLPPHAFPIMVIHFLQQCSPPVLPVLHELKQQQQQKESSSGQEQESLPGTAEENAEIYASPEEVKCWQWQSSNTQSVGSLWAALFYYYGAQFRWRRYVIQIRQSKPMRITDKHWSNRVLAIEDPFVRRRCLSRSVAVDIMHVYIWRCFRRSAIYFNVPTTSDGPVFDIRDAVDISKDPDTDAEEEDVEPEVAAGVPEAESGSNDDDDADDLSSGVEVLDQKKGDDNDDDNSDDDSSSELSDLEFYQGGEDAEYFEHAAAIIQSLDLNSGKPLEDEGVEEDKNNNNNDDVTVNDDGADNHQDEPSSGSASDEPIKKTKKAKNAGKSGISSVPPPKIGGKTVKPDVKPVNGVTAPVLVSVFDRLSPVPDFKAEEYVYSFDLKEFNDKQSFPIVCSVCRVEGHLTENCPDDKLPELEALPALSRQLFHVLDIVCSQVEERYIPKSTEQDARVREKIKAQVEQFVKKIYPDAHLSVFGSSRNGFGLVGSDLDLCLKFDGIESGAELDQSTIILKISAELEASKLFFDIVPITTAKVPIVKFVHRESRMECDISLYNVLAEHNTRLLRTYCDIDPRVRMVGNAFKYLAKICQMGDASKGSLSSYAYVIMALHYLQRCDPPVVPCLQELIPPGEAAPVVTVDSWNAWFFDDLEKLPEVWSGYGKNTKSVGELWLGLLRYYTEEFDFARYVVCMRRMKPLSRLEKFWTPHGMAIEDPFELDHNLGSAVSRKMCRYIRKTLMNARTVFSRYVENGVPKNKLMDYYFDPRALMDGEPPKDRSCRECGKIGHFQNDCPQRKRRMGQEVSQLKRAADEAAAAKAQGARRHKGKRNGAVEPPTAAELKMAANRDTEVPAAASSAVAAAAPASAAAEPAGGKVKPGKNKSSKTVKKEKVATGNEVSEKAGKSVKDKATAREKKGDAKGKKEIDAGKTAKSKKSSQRTTEEEGSNKGDVKVQTQQKTKAAAAVPRLQMPATQDNIVGRDVHQPASKAPPTKAHAPVGVRSQPSQPPPFVVPGMGVPSRNVPPPFSTSSHVTRPQAPPFGIVGGAMPFSPSQATPPTAVAAPPTLGGDVDDSVDKYKERLHLSCLLEKLNASGQQLSHSPQVQQFPPSLPSMTSCFQQSPSTPPRFPGQMPFGVVGVSPSSSAEAFGQMSLNDQQQQPCYGVSPPRRYPDTVIPPFSSAMAAMVNNGPVGNNAVLPQNAVPVMPGIYPMASQHHPQMNLPPPRSDVKDSLSFGCFGDLNSMFPNVTGPPPYPPPFRVPSDHHHPNPHTSSPSFNPPTPSFMGGTAAPSPIISLGSRFPMTSTSSTSHTMSPPPNMYGGMPLAPPSSFAPLLGGGIDVFSSPPPPQQQQSFPEHSNPQP